MVNIGELLHCVEIKTGENDTGILDEMLEVLELEHSWVVDVDRHTCQVLVVCFSRAEAEGKLETIRTALPDWADMLETPAPVTGILEVRREDWAESWKQFFKPFRASRRLVVKPTWENFAAQPEDILLEIDPGMSFGTGHHGTTKAVLQFLDELQEELGSVPFLDAGSGSGILTLAAARLGYAPLAAFDYDPEAVKCTKENLELGGIRNVTVTCEDVAKYQPAHPFRVVAANILAVVLIEHARHIATLVHREPGKPSFLLLAGILNAQYDSVKGAYEPLGFKERRRVTIDEWTSGIFETGEITN